MYLLCEQRRAGHYRRVGFTLIELLVVIAIIGILATLTTSAVMRFMGVQPVTNTKMVITKLSSNLRKKWAEVTEQARKDTILAPYLAAVQFEGGGDPARERLIYIKIKQKQAFPETFYEALNGFTVGGQSIPPLPGYVAALNKSGFFATSYTNPGYTPANYESSVCLLMALRRAVSGGGGVTEPDVGVDTISTTVVPGGAPCLIDAWGNPLAFCRWPLGNPSAPVADPTDPPIPTTNLGLLASPTWLNAPGATDFGTNVHAVLKSSGRLTPVIASMGAKGGAVLDFANPGTATHWQVLIPAQANDVIYSFNLN